MNRVWHFIPALLLSTLYGCANEPTQSRQDDPSRQRQAESRPETYGSISSYAVPRGEGAGNEMEYCFHYSKRVWELGTLIGESKLTPQQAREAVDSSLGALGAAEDLSDLDKLNSGEYKTAEQMAATRFVRCARTLKLPVEDRHLAIAQSCFDLLKLPRYVYGLRSGGRTAEQARVALQMTNSPTSHRLIETVVADVYSTISMDQFNALSRKMFLSCIVAGGSPKVRSPSP